MMLAEDYRHAAEADNTKLAHRKDLARFLAWGGRIPSDSAQISAYLTESAATHKPATLARWLASLSVAHMAAGIDPPPTRMLEVRQTLAGIRAVHGAKQRRVRPICTEEIVAIVDSLGQTPADLRNKALMLVSFSGALRRSEAVALTVANCRFEPRGMQLDLGGTKTDAAGANSEITIAAAANPKYCPVLALKAWLHVGGIHGGPVFRAISRHGKISAHALSGQAFADITKSMVRKIGLDIDDFSGHSLRAGLVTSAVRANKPQHKIMETTRHRSAESLTRYIRDAESFDDNAGALL